MQTFFLWNALTIVPDRKQSIAVVGGGGKTSLIFRLCEEMVSTGNRQADSKQYLGIEQELVTAASGEVIPLSEVKDAVFSQKMMGDGYAVEPSNGKVYAPVNGKVTSVF
mgnify:CR=1 FL=1